MFGYPAAFVHGHMFAGLHEDRVVLRLDEAGIAEAKQHGATGLRAHARAPHERLGRGDGTLAADEPALRRGVARAFRHTATLPPKARRKAAGSRPSPRAAARSRRAR